MANVVLPTSDYTKLVKEYTPVGQQQTLWEQFLTGTQQTYQGLAQQAQDVYAYDISEAYANYKQQQLQLQMNEQLGEGFKGQLGTQLQTQYGTAYEDIKSQETSVLSDIATQYASAIETGEEQFTELGKQFKTFDDILSEYAEYAGVSTPENMYKETINEDGSISYELTDYGKIWYSDVINATPENKKLLDQWLLSDEYSGELDYEEREAIWEAYRQNPDLFRSQIAGLTSDFDVEATRTRLQEEEKQAAYAAIANAQNLDVIKQIYGENFEKLSPEQAREIQAGVQRTSDYVGTLKGVNTTGGIDKVVTDKYGNSWTITSYAFGWSEDTGGYRDKQAKTLAQELGMIDSKGYVVKTNYEKGDIIKHNGKYYVITQYSLNDFLLSTPTVTFREIRPGDFNYEGAVSRVF